jgi:hypothetical protein
MGAGVDDPERTDIQLPFDIGNDIGRGGGRECEDCR